MADQSLRTPGPAGIVICRCGTLMNDCLDVSALSRRAGPDPRVALVREQTYSCFGDGLDAIVQTARTHPVLVAACSPALHGPTLARALEQAGLPPDRARLVDVRGEAWTCRSRARGSANAEALLADALDEVDRGDHPVAERRVALVGGGPAAAEAAALLESSGVPVDWLDDPVELEAPGPAVTRVERTATGFRIERGEATPLTAGAIVLAFEPLDFPPEAMRPAFEPGAQVLDLTSAEAALELATTGGPAAPTGDSEGERLAGASEGERGPGRSPGGISRSGSPAPGEPAPRGLAGASEGERGPGRSPGGVSRSGSPASGEPALSREAPAVVALLTGCIAGLPRPRAPGVGLARMLEVALALHERWPRTRMLLFHGDDTGAPAELESLLASFRREAGGVTVRGAVHRGVYSEGAIHVHATDRDLARRVLVAADLCIVDPGQQDDPRALEWCTLLGIPDPRELSAGGVFTRIPGVLVASGPGPISPEDAALRGAACAAHCLARILRP